MEQNYYVNFWQQWRPVCLPLPSRLNPFVKEGVELSVAVAVHTPCGGIKFWTVLGLLQGARTQDLLEDTRVIVEATSGNTGAALVSMARSFGIHRVVLVVKPDVPEGKRYPLKMAGAEIMEPHKGFSAIATARKMGGGGWKAISWQPDNGWLNLDQYANPAGTLLHQSFTAPRILDQLSYPPTVWVAGIGTGGTITGIGRYLHQKIPKARVVGVLLVKGQEIPGVRDLDNLKEVPLALQWIKQGGETVEIPARPSYLAMTWLIQSAGIGAGPSSGFAYLGALKFLQNHQKAGTLDSLRDDQGRIHVVVLLPDGNGPYGDRWMTWLPEACQNVATAPLPWEWENNEIW